MPMKSIRERVEIPAKSRARSKRRSLTGARLLRARLATMSFQRRLAVPRRLRFEREHRLAAVVKGELFHVGGGDARGVHADDRRADRSVGGKRGVDPFRD